MLVWTDCSVVMHCPCRRPKLRSQLQCLPAVIPAPGNPTSLVTIEGIVFMGKPLQRHVHLPPPIKYYTVALWEQG